MSSGLRRLFTGAAAWTVAAVASVAVSMLALTVIGGVGGDVQPPAPRPAVDSGLAGAATGDTASPATSATTTPTSSASASPTPPAAATGPAAASPTPGPPRQFTTSAGVVTAQCIGQLAYLASWSPAPGFRVDDVRRGPAIVARVTFVMFSTRQETELAVRCAAGVPTLVHAR